MPPSDAAPSPCQGRCARTSRADGRPPDPVRVAEEVAGTLTAAPGVTVDYVEVLDPETLAPPDATRGQADDEVPEADELLIAVAAFVGPVRLIDNVVVGDAGDEERLLAATS
jgi:pantoate--beta-alanine ligase